MAHRRWYVKKQMPIMDPCALCPTSNDDLGFMLFPKDNVILGNYAQ